MLLVRCGSLVPVGAPWNLCKPEISREFRRPHLLEVAQELGRVAAAAVVVVVVFIAMIMIIINAVIIAIAIHLNK